MTPFQDILVYLESRPEGRAGLELARSGESASTCSERSPRLSLNRACASRITSRGAARSSSWSRVIVHRRDRVINTADGGAPLRPWLFDSTAMHLVRKAPCPAWITKAGSPEPPRQIVAAIDPLRAAKDPLSERIVGTALDLAERPGARLRVEGAWSSPGGGILRTTLGRDRLSRCGAPGRRPEKDGLEETVTRVGAAGTHDLAGEAQDVVPDFVAIRGERRLPPSKGDRR